MQKTLDLGFEVVGVVGSREYPFLQDVRDYVMSLPRATWIVSGGAIGVDRCAVETAKSRSMRTFEILPDYQAHGEDAPWKRNQKIASSCDRLVVFWDGVSTGTLSTIRATRALDKDILVFPPEHRWVGRSDLGDWRG